jgi:hypothetical protein
MPCGSTFVRPSRSTLRGSKTAYKSHPYMLFPEILCKDREKRLSEKGAFTLEDILR